MGWILNNMGNGVKGRGRGLISSTIKNSMPGGLQRTHNDLGKDTRSCGPDMKLGLSKYKRNMICVFLSTLCDKEHRVSQRTVYLMRQDKNKPDSGFCATVYSMSFSLTYNFRIRSLKDTKTTEYTNLTTYTNVTCNIRCLCLHFF